MKDDELRQQVIDTAIDMAKQWRGVDALIEEGKLTARPGGWYELSNPSALESIGRITKTIETGTGTNRAPRVKLTKPDAKLMAMADEYSD